MNLNCGNWTHYLGGINFVNDGVAKTGRHDTPHNDIQHDNAQHTLGSGQGVHSALEFARTS